MNLLYYRNWKTMARTVAWILAVIVVYRRRAYIEIALALMEYALQARERRYREDYEY